MSTYHSKLYPQSVYRKSGEGKRASIELDLDLPDLSGLSLKLKDALTQLVIHLNDMVLRVLLSSASDVGATRYLALIFKKMNVQWKKSKAHKTSIEVLWGSIETHVLNNIKYHLLRLHASDILVKFTAKIKGIVRQYARYLPYHVAQSEEDDLMTIAQLEFLETFKVWNPKKNDDIWPLAYTRIRGAMKDHIRYISKSDPTRFYEWVTDAAHVYMLQHKERDFESQIETGVQLNQAMSVLTIREKRIVVLYSKKDMTFQEISEITNISESQVSRIYKEAVKKIKRSIVIDEQLD